MTTGDLFDEPAPKRDPPGPRAPKPWNTGHPEHPSRRPENALQPGEDPPRLWNVATDTLGIQHMRKFLEWCDGHGIDRAGHTVGTLYVDVGAHSRESFRFLCQALRAESFDKLPSSSALRRTMSARRARLLYSDGDA